MTNYHATCVAKSGAGILLRGPSGAGKSDLALRLMARGWRLVADDQVDLRVSGGLLIAAPPAGLAGLIEVRGAGISRVAHAVSAPVSLAANLSRPGAAERMPDPGVCTIEGCSLPEIEVSPFESSALEKIEFALARCIAQGGVTHDGMVGTAA